MPVRFQHDQQPNSFYFVTFTCYKWLSLFQEANAYDAVYRWFDSLFKNNIHVTGYVVMPNHLHVLLYFPQMTKSLNILIENAKRFLAYDIIEKLEEKKANHLLDVLHAGVKKRESKKARCTKFLKIALMQKIATLRNSFLKNSITCIIIRLARNGSW
jgi:REP element-mobilizing transposase RayT